MSSSSSISTLEVLTASSQVHQQLEPLVSKGKVLSSKLKLNRWWEERERREMNGGSLRGRKGEKVGR